MNMKDIAVLAGVSISTVSKVLNNKVSDISETTRKKVLDVINENNYQPYKNKNGFHCKTHVLAVVIPSLIKNFFSRLLDSIEREAAKNGYAIAVYCSHFDDMLEEQLVNTLEDRDNDAIILVTLSKKNIDKFSNNSKQVVVIGVEHEILPSFYFDFAQISERAVSELLNNEHKYVGCILEFHSDEFTQGARLAISQAGLSTENFFFTTISKDVDIEKSIKRFTALGVTAFFCSSIKIASRIYKFIAKRYWEITKDFSLIAFEDELVPDIFFPPISTVSISLERLATDSVQSLIEFIEHNTPIVRHTRGEIFFNKTASISSPSYTLEKRIVVIGSLNMDTILSVPHLPQKGETIMARSKRSIPGGKGANQAIGVGRLNGYVSIIGRLGDDIKGREIYRNLLDNNVKVEGIFFDSKHSTGSAYIIVDENGNNSITVHGGANDFLDIGQLEKAKKIIANSSYALIQTEIPLETVKSAIQLCKSCAVKIILKPAPPVELPLECFKNLFLFIPNEIEAKSLCPEGHTLEEQAAFFIAKGVKHVIITLGEKGVLYTDGIKIEYYEACNFTPIDTTGASDAFISALSVYLSEKNSMESAILYASYAAGLSITKEGVQTSLPTREQMSTFEKK